MGRYFLDEKFKVYCRRGDAVHVFRAAGKVVVCETDGYRLHSANIIAWYASDGDVVSLPDDARI